MRCIWACLVLACGFPSLLRAADDELVEARGLLLSGKYAEAAEIYQRLAADNPGARLGLARSLAAEGKAGEAVRELTSGRAGDAALHPDLDAELARLAFERGDYESAERHVEAALREDANQLLARWIQGELFRSRGKVKEADEAYLWLVRFYNQHEAEIGIGLSAGV